MEQAVFGTILEPREEKHETGRNVATSQRRDVGSTLRRSQQVANVATPQRRDVSAISPSQSLKAKRDENSKGSKNVRTRARKAE